MTDDAERIAEVARKLGTAQKRAILALGVSWGPSGEYRACVRLWCRDDIPLLLDHQFQTNDSWKLRSLGLAIRQHLLEQGR